MMRSLELREILIACCNTLRGFPLCHLKPVDFPLAQGHPTQLAIMRTILVTAFCIANFCLTASLRADDALFSEVAMESVYEKNTPLDSAVASQSDGATLERITGPTALGLALKAAEFSPKQTGERVTTQVEYATWKFPVSLEVKLEQDRVSCELSLAQIKDISKVDQESLLKLLSQNDGDSSAFFAYNPQTKVVQLRSSFDNRGLTSKKLKTELTRLAKFADEHSALWSSLGQSAKADAKSASIKPLSLIGNWAGTLKTGQAIAIQINQAGTFRLVTVQSGKSSVSQGTYKLEGNQLTLSGNDKVTLNCTATQSTANAFQLSIGAGSGAAKLVVDLTKAK